MTDLHAGADNGVIDNSQLIPLVEIEAVLDELLELGERGASLAVDTIVCQAVLHGASDLHLEPWPDCLSVRYRLDGVLHEIAMLSKRHQERVVARVKVLASLVIYQKETPQDGRIDASKERLGRALRASTFPTIYGEKIVIRILDHQEHLMSVEALGFRSEVVQGLRKLLLRPQGTILLTGPSSAGKTTTIYSLLRELVLGHAADRHIVTIEDPVEYQLGRISQTQINPQLDFTFEAALRSLLRQDPDVIMIGEIRDSDTARTAIQAGLTGHLVISTIHSGTAAGVFTRLLDMGIEPFLAASSVNGVLAQRLVRKACEHCGEAYEPDPLLIAQYDIDPKGAEFRRGIGCSECRGIGFRGRTAIGELLIVDDEIAEMILTRARTRQLHEVAVRNGMTPLLEHALEKACMGETTLEELQLVVPPPDDVENAISTALLARRRAAKKKPAKSASKSKSKTKAKASAKKQTEE